MAYNSIFRTITVRTVELSDRDVVCGVRYGSGRILLSSGRLCLARKNPRIIACWVEFIQATTVGSNVKCMPHFDIFLRLRYS
jgi:hypothetical protein